MKHIAPIIALLILSQEVKAQDSSVVRNFIHALKYIEADVSSRLSESFYNNYDKDTLILINAIVSEDKIKNNASLVLCDFIKKEYQAPENCAVLFGENRLIVQRVRDSIQSVQRSKDFKGYKFNYQEDISRNERKGYLVKFSHLVNNTLMAEVGYSSNLKEGFSSGKTTIYYFTFNETGLIKKVFEGSKFYN